MKKDEIILKEGWSLSKRFRYVPFDELNPEDQQRIESGEIYRLQGHALVHCWLYPVRRDGRLTRCTRRVRLNLHDRPQQKIRILSPAQATAYLDQVRDGPWESWTYSGDRELKLSKDYYRAERLPELRQKMLDAFGATLSPATPLGIAWVPPGAYDKPHFHDVDVMVLALSKRNDTGQLGVKQRGRWKTLPYDIGEGALIPKYVEHRVYPTSIDRFTATLSILD